MCLLFSGMVWACWSRVLSRSCVWFQTTCFSSSVGLREACSTKVPSRLPLESGLREWMYIQDSRIKCQEERRWGCGEERERNALALFPLRNYRSQDKHYNLTTSKGNFYYKHYNPLERKRNFHSRIKLQFI